MRGLFDPVPAELTKQGEMLVGVIRRTDKPKDARPKTLGRDAWDDGLAAHVATMADNDTVQVEVIFDGEGRRTARLVGVAPLARVEHDREREKAIQARGGFLNPYTFVPTPPRTGLADTGLGDAPPPSHALHTDGQWSGILALTLTTVTPLLLPVPAPRQPKDGPRTFDVRVDPNGLPLIHGASVKGALRSAYETITASRYGVFSDHHDRLAYRVPPNTPLNLTPARVHRHEDGTAFFRLCRGDADWARNSRSGNQTQYAALVPAYGPRRVERIGELADGPLSRHHGTEVYARVVAGRDGKDTGGSGAWRVTHLARTEQELQARLRAPVARSGPSTNGRHRIMHGWLSATGHSIASKRNERLFVETPGLDVPLTHDHERHWQSVLRAYDLAHGYHDPRATYQRDPATANGIERSRHVPSDPRLRSLPHGTLVYVRYDDKHHEITEVHPVMIGRLPFDAAPSELLHTSLRPAQDRDQLSPADRLFGWVPPGRRDDDGETNDGTSGYRGRLRVRSITCTTDDWRPASFPPEGVTLAPLSSPKPTQFRFYASTDPTGTPVKRGTRKADGYAAGSGLRGRKMYRWREEEPKYWQPETDQEDPTRGYLALDNHRNKPKQLVRHRGWVRPEVTFQVELFLDGVPEPELGALLWLLTRDTAAPLRLGAGKPYGFGVVNARLDADRTRLWDAHGVRAGWLRLTRPDPVGPERLIALADQFAATARGNEVLREATESYLAASAPVTEPVHYPRTPQPQAESYEWFVANDRIKGSTVVEGWALPHVRDPQQQLPYLGRDPGSDDVTGRDTRNGRHRPKPVPRSVPRQGQRSAFGHGADRPAPTPKDRRGPRPS